MGDQGILSQLQTNNSFSNSNCSPTDLEGGDPTPPKEVFSKPCPACCGPGKTPGKFNKIVKVEKIKIKCTRCVGGYIQVTCNNCVKGINAEGKECKTCKGTGKYVYIPTVKYPSGKLCKYCQEEGKILRLDEGSGYIIKNKIISAPVTCTKCKGTGTIKYFIFNPVIKQEDLELISIIDKMTDEMFKPLELSGAA